MQNSIFFSFFEIYHKICLNCIEKEWNVSSCIMIFRLCQINLFTSKLYQSNNNIWLSLYYMHVVVLYSIFFLGENDWVCFLLPLVKCGKIIVVDRFSVKKGEFSRTKKTAYSTTTNTMIWNHKNCLVLSRPLTFQQNKIKFFVLPRIVRDEKILLAVYK